jgi:hypothetical protein
LHGIHGAGEIGKDASATCPDEVSTVGLLLSTPDGTPAVGITACYTGPVAEGERILKPFGTFGSPLTNLIARRRYTEMQSLFDQNWVPGQLNYWKTNLVRALSDGLSRFCSTTHRSGQLQAP